MAELAQFAARQSLPQLAGLSAPPGLSPHPWPLTFARTRGPRTYPLLTPPPGEKNNEGLRQRLEKLTETMREVADRVRAADHEYEMLAKLRELSRNGEDPDQAAPDQAPADQAGLTAEGDVPSPDCSCCGLPIACPH